MRVVFWQNEVSFHQASLIGGVHEAGAEEVVWIAERSISDQRKALGWRVREPEGVRVIVAPRPSEVRRWARSSDRETVHVFSGLRAYPMVWMAFRYAAESAAVRLLMAEPGVTFLDWKWPRLLRARWDVRRYGRDIDGVLAIGGYGVEWYRAVGYPEDRVFPFGYFVEAPRISGAKASSASPAEEFAIVYLGRLLRTKGVEDLLRALSRMKDDAWVLQVVGEGPERERLKRRSAYLFGSDGLRVRFAGAQDHVKCMQVLQNADLLVLPSRGIEGWGVVVNEALQLGVPVLCTETVGSSVLVRASRGGDVVEAGSREALCRALRGRVCAGPVSLQERERLRTWGQCISGMEAGRYLLRIVEWLRRGGSRPVPCWENWNAV